MGIASLHPSYALCFMIYLFATGGFVMPEIERVTTVSPEPSADVGELRRRWDAGKASGLAGEMEIHDLIADEKAKEARRH
jgi:hypothetical protein